ncbi:MAG: LacI family transcriptional regulator [Verrucomicrobia bacterium]|nr:LacI family transcriptional regulator [Verrucomicrobiota bacterium]MBU4248515.1 LacI family transcriptional regulator [Verrucomicrobiota bacterium]MBU4292147.1 LacI family transcriptional regulator [Verrucomicrobiota bacterium]MBU4497336.1 LacI family transcriptional regulator [Verrucomicrobiota bacterium]MCG2680268.1 LacI family transcriptional regulator [Kiritimatiellia bacterium]
MKRKNLSQLSARVTVARVAAECGVSIMTVSRALHNAPRVAEGTRISILRAADALGYRLQPGCGRPRLITKKARSVVDVILGTALTSESLFYTRLLFAIERALSRYGHDCLIRTCNGRFEDFLSLYETLRESGATGRLFVGYLPVKQIQMLLDLDPHMILVDYTGDPCLHGPYEYVGFDTPAAVRLAVRHLWERGRRRIALVRGPLAHHFARETEKGYVETLTEYGQTVARRLILEADFTAENARQVMSAAIADDVVCDAVFTNDEMATGVLRALYERGRRVPADVAVVGCDGLSLGRQTIPQLTTVRLDYEQMGQVAVERLFSGREKNAPVFRVRFVPELVVRESS